MSYINQLIEMITEEELKIINMLIIGFFIDSFPNVQIDIIQKEVNIVLNNLNTEKCYNLRLIGSSSFGVTGITFDNTSYNYNYLIPNVLRKCYVLNKLYIPNICPTYVQKSSRVIKFEPILLDDNLIKSFLYFGIPVNIKYFSSYVNNIKLVLNKKKIVLAQKITSTNYGFYTTGPQLYALIYNENTLLTNLVNFNTYIDNSYAYKLDSKIDSNYQIPWEFTQNCINNNINNNDTFINGNKNYEYKISATNCSTIYKLNRYLDNYLPLINSNVVTNVDINVLTDTALLNNLNRVLNISYEVYQDIITELQYNIESLQYCKKSYMDKSNVPLIIELYKNFYNNQIESNKKAMPVVSIRDVVPVIDTIYEYAEKYKTIYLSTYPTRYYLKNIVLDQYYSIIIFTNVSNWKEDVPNSTITQIDYYYYYLNVKNVVPLELFNLNDSLPSFNSTYTNLNNFVSVFNTEFNVKYGISISKKFNTFNNDGLFPEGGTIYNNENKGYTYGYYNITSGLITNTELLYSIYLTLRSYSPYIPQDLNGKGLALIYFKQY